MKWAILPIELLSAIVLAKAIFAQNLELQYSTYLGGSDYDYGRAIAVEAGEAYVTGATHSSDFPTINAYQRSLFADDAFVTKLSSTGSRLIYSTYLGGYSGDYGHAIATENGEAYITGFTYSNLFFPIVNAYQSSFGGGFGDAFIIKISSSGSRLLYSTYLGGNDWDLSHGITVINGEAFLTGDTLSSNFPTLNAYQPNLEGSNYNVFISRLSSTGSQLLYSTYLGGGADSNGQSIAVENGEAYVAGDTYSTTFPVLNPYQASLRGDFDAFLSRLSSSGSYLLYSTYLGGGGSDHGNAVAVENGEAYMTGRTRASNFPTVDAYQSTRNGDGTTFDIFVTKFDTTGSRILYSTYLGGDNDDYGYSIAVENGEAYATGFTLSSDFATVKPYQPGWSANTDIFLSIVSSSGSQLICSTYLGGSDNEYSEGIAVKNGGIYMTGQTFSYDFPTANAYQTSLGGSRDAFVIKLSMVPEPTPTPAAAARRWIYDFNGDGTSDIAVFRPSAGMWSIRNLSRIYLGAEADDLVPGDYDGDGTTDAAIFRENSGMWSVRNVSRFFLGSSNDWPVPGDYDGDGTAEAGIFRESSGLWSIRNLTRAYLGAAGDTVIPGFYDSDAAKDIAIFRGSSGMWSVRNVTRFYFATAGDELVPGDYSGAERWEAGIFRPSTGMWSIRNVTRFYLGSAGDWALPADYDGNGIDEAGIFRGSTGMWSVRDLTRLYFGSTDDVPAVR